MNKLLLPFVRLHGDIVLSVNGENKVGFSIDGNWTTNFTNTIMGDQGCIFQHKNSNSEDLSALNTVCNILENIELVPYQNDSTYEKYVTETAKKWFNEVLPETLKETFHNDPEAYKVEASFTEEGETDPSIVVRVELTTNEYVNTIFKSLNNIAHIGNIKSATLNDDNSVIIVYEDLDGNENTITRSFDHKVILLGVDGFTNSEKIYECDDGYLIITVDNFIPVISESKIVKI